MMKKCKDTSQNTLIASGKQNLEELAKLTILNILSAKGIIYTHYKNKREENNERNRQARIFY